MSELNERWQATGPGDVVQLRWPGGAPPAPRPPPVNGNGPIDANAVAAVERRR